MRFPQQVLRPYHRLNIMVLNTEWAQVEVIDLINDGSGLAFGIIGGRSTGVVVKTILPGGVADRDGRLQSGDHILQIGEVNLRGLGSEQVASVLRQCGVHVRLVVARPVESTSGDYQSLGSSAPIVPTKILGDPVELDRHLIETGYVGEIPIARRPSEMFPPGSLIYNPRQSNDSSMMQAHQISGIVDVVRNPLPIGQVPPQKSPPATVPGQNFLPLDMALREPNLPETECYTVQLCKDDLGLGITVAGYVCEKEEISGIFVKSISRGSAADLDGQIKINDRIVEVDGRSVVGHTNHQSVELLRNTGSIVTIKLERYLRGPKYEQLQQAIRANELLRPPSPPSPSLSSLPKVPLSMVHMSYLNIDPEPESRTSVDFDSAVLLDAPTTEEDKEIVILDSVSVQFSIESHDSIYDKWKGVFGDDVEIIIAQMEKERSTGLGISLEGTVDIEDGKEVRPHHYIRNILPHGPVGKNGVLKSGDELLEVNGIKLAGLNHLEVVAILKQLPDFVILTVARRPQATRIIDTSQHRDAFKARNILAGSLQSIVPPHPHDKMVKAKSETSLASSGAASDMCSVGTIGSRSRSLEIIEGIPMWSTERTVIELHKGDHGLGFSILDYQDPLNNKETVIVIRSLIPGGVAQNDGRLIPGDRLLAVNDINLEHASLDRAVQVLKGAPKGKVKITVAKPLSANETNSSFNNSQHLLKIIQEWNREISALNVDTDEHDDQMTCLDDFQECIEEYQECLEVVRMCIGDNEEADGSSMCCPIVDTHEFDLSIEAKSNPNNAANISESEADLSYKSLSNDPEVDSKAQKVQSHSNKINLKEPHSIVGAVVNNPISQLTLSKPDDNASDEKDGYETCAEENSFSEDIALPTKVENVNKVVFNGANVSGRFSEINSDVASNLSKISDVDVDKTPTNSMTKLCEVPDVINETSVFLSDTEKTDLLKDIKDQKDVDELSILLDEIPPPILDDLIEGPLDGRKSVTFGISEFVDSYYIPTTKSEPCLLDTIETTPRNHISLDTKICDEGLQMILKCSNCKHHKTTSSQGSNTNCSVDGDEFFLVQCPTTGMVESEEIIKEPVTRCNSEPNVLKDKSKDSPSLSPNKSVHVQSSSFSGGSRKKFQRRRLVEYYNDFDECLSMLHAMAGISQENKKSSQEAVVPRVEEFMNPKKSVSPLNNKIYNSVPSEIKCSDDTLDYINNQTYKLGECDVNLKSSVMFVKRLSNKPEMSDDEIFDKIVIKPRSNSIPSNIWLMDYGTEEDILAELSKVASCNICYDQHEKGLLGHGDNTKRRKSAFVPGYCCYMELVELYHQQFLEIQREERSGRVTLQPPIQVRATVPVVPSVSTSKDRRREESRIKQTEERKDKKPKHRPPEIDIKEGRLMTVTRSAPSQVVTNSARSSGCATHEVEDMLQKHWGTTRIVKVSRGDGKNSKGIGISIVGGKVDLCAPGDNTQQETVLGIFVKSVVPGGPADRTGQLKTGDRILEVGGVDLRCATHEKAVEAIRKASDPVVFLVQSLVPWSIESEDSERNGGECPSPHPSPVDLKSPVSFEKKEKKHNKVIFNDVSTHLEPPKKTDYIANDAGVKNELAPSPTPGAPSPVIVTSDDESDDEDVRDLEGRTVTAKGQEIDRASAANVKRTKEEIAADDEEEDDFGYTSNKAKKKYAALGHSIHLVQLERGAGSQGLGLSLAGHRDRNCMAVFVCGINPTGAAHRAGSVQVGDEILEVNGVVLHGRCHLNASAIIKGLSGPIFKLVILRRKTAINDIAVRPITQFPVSLAEEASEESFSHYPNVRSITIKKQAGHSLGIMIIEGKHAEVGQGIFISDIQEGSSAEKAGLEIGEMILAVNKDSLLGSNYDSAANLLKRTEGLVKLVVSNPGKRPTTPVAPEVDKKNTSNKPGLKPSGPPSRPLTPVPEPPADPLTCSIIPGRETIIEIVTDNKPLGLYFVGGKDTPLSDGVVVLEVFAKGAAEKDNRLQPGDQIIEANGTHMKDATYTTALQALRQLLPKMKLVILRPEKIEYQTIDIEFAKKPGKSIGISVMARKNGKGVYITDILQGSPAEIDGRIMKGDLLVSVNGANIENASGEEAAAVLKTVTGRAFLKLHRYRLHPR